jgi:hypothetical protein
VIGSGATYYRWERVVLDLIASAQNVCFGDDWGEEAKADAAQLFYDILVGGGDIDAAYATAANISSDLTFHSREVGK